MEQTIGGEKMSKKEIELAIDEIYMCYLNQYLNEDLKRIKGNFKAFGWLAVARSDMLILRAIYDMVHLSEIISERILSTAEELTNGN